MQCKGVDSVHTTFLKLCWLSCREWMLFCCCYFCLLLVSSSSWEKDLSQSGYKSSEVLLIFSSKLWPFTGCNQAPFVLKVICNYITVTSTKTRTNIFSIYFICFVLYNIVLWGLQCSKHQCKVKSFVTFHTKTHFYILSAILFYYVLSGCCTFHFLHFS